MGKQSILITGCSAGGIGSALALEFLSKSFLVFATARELKKIQHLCDAGCEVIQMDVCDDKSVLAARPIVESKLDGRGLDYIVNNAGMTYLTPTLDASITEVRRVLNTNVVSAILVTQTFFPLLMKAKGAVVNIGSVAPMMISAYAGLYSGSKAALEILSHQMRMEFEPFGVDVVHVITGVVQTSLQATDRTKHGRTPSSSLYYPIADIIAHVEDPWVANAQPAAVFAQRLVRKIAVKGRKPALVYEGASVALFRWISAILWLISFFAGVRIWDSIGAKPAGFLELKKLMREREGGRSFERTTQSKNC